MSIVPTPTTSTRHGSSSLTIHSSPPNHLLHPSTISLPFCNSPSPFALLTLAKHPNPPLNKFAAAVSNGFLHTSDYIDERAVPGQLGLDELLSVGEVLCGAPPIVYSLGCLLSFALPAAHQRFQPCLGSKAFALQYVLLVGALAIGSLIRWRQWRRICRVDQNGSSVNLVGRIEKVEEDLQSSATIVRVLSRQLEKLGVRFRVTKRTVKELIAEILTLLRGLLLVYLMLVSWRCQFPVLSACCFFRCSFGFSGLLYLYLIQDFCICICISEFCICI